jgi:hypothetical protein
MIKDWMECALWFVRWPYNGSIWIVGLYFVQLEALGDRLGSVLLDIVEKATKPSRVIGRVRKWRFISILKPQTKYQSGERSWKSYVVQRNSSFINLFLSRSYQLLVCSGDSLLT